MTAIRIEACRREELPVVQRLAEVIWRRHYPGIIADEQIDYMLSRGYSSTALSRFLDAPHAGLAVARVDREPVAFAAWLPVDEPATMKLDKLYVLQEWQGHGVGRRLIAHVEAQARREHCSRLILNVNKRNTASMAAYERCGFTRRGAVVVDIGNGYVMDDYVMAKILGA